MITVAYRGGGGWGGLLVIIRFSAAMFKISN